MALEKTPLPQSQGSRLPPPPTIKTTFSGAGGEDQPYEILLADQALRLIRRVNEAEPTELPSIHRALKMQQELVQDELDRIRLVNGTPAWTVWLPFFGPRRDAFDPSTVLVVTLRALDESGVRVQALMRQFHIPHFIMELA